MSDTIKTFLEDGKLKTSLIISDLNNFENGSSGIGPLPIISDIFVIISHVYLLLDNLLFLVFGILSVLCVFCVLGNFDILALSVFDDGNMPAIQLIPRGGLKSPHSYEGWIVVWSR